MPKAKVLPVKGECPPGYHLVRRHKFRHWKSGKEVYRGPFCRKNPVRK